MAFSTVNGQIINSNSQPFVAGGINVMEGQQPDIGTLQSDFPGINFVRLAVFDYASPDALASYVNSLTNAGIVVEIEDHNNGGGNSGGAQGQIFSGSQLSNELNWFSSVATAFKDNPNVWFGTNNEPSSTDASGNSNPAALSAWQQQTYQAVRDTGNNNPILLEANSSGAGQTNIGYDAAAYAGMHNVVWDVHFYGWLSGYSTDQSTVSNALSGIASDTHAIQSADGQIPIIVGEYGNSTTGSTIDGNADQVINAVQQSGMGYAAWAWCPGYPGDGLNNGGNGLSGYGQQVAAGIASGAATSPPVPAPAPAPTPAPMPTSFTPSPDNAVIAAGSNGTITDAAGHAWTMTAGATVNEDGYAVGYSANVIQLAYENGVVWQGNAAGGWWGWDGSGWNIGNGTTTSPVPSAPTPIPPAPTPAPQIFVSSGGVTQSASTDGTAAAGDIFSLTASGGVKAALGDINSFVRFIGGSGVDVTGGSASGIVSATAGSNTFTVGSGSLDITGGIGANSYISHAGSGFLTINDFSVAKGDSLTFDQSLQGSMVQTDDGTGGTLISFGGNAAVDLRGVTSVLTTAVQFA